MKHSTKVNTVIGRSWVWNMACVFTSSLAVATALLAIQALNGSTATWGQIGLVSLIAGLLIATLGAAAQMARRNRID